MRPPKELLFLGFVTAGLACGGVLYIGGLDGAADAAIAAQAVLCVIMPDACGLGGDLLALVRRPGEGLLAINGTGATPAGSAAQPICAMARNNIASIGFIFNPFPFINI